MRAVRIAPVIDADRLPSKVEVKCWLKKIKRNRAWLAEQCGVSIGQVHNWFSVSGVIPKKAALLIRLLMDTQKSFPLNRENVASSCFQFGGDLSQASPDFVLVVIKVAQQMRTTPEIAVSYIFDEIMRSKECASFVDARRKEVFHA